jgi:hypothetical protein
MSLNFCKDYDGSGDSFNDGCFLIAIILGFNFNGFGEDSYPFKKQESEHNLSNLF